MNRNIYIDSIKLVLALIVALGHFGISGRIDAGFAVTVFFIISGYYLAKGSKKSSSAAYMFKRIKKMYPKYIAVYVVALAFTIKNWIGGGFSFRSAVDSVQELLLLQGFGYTTTSVNPTMWFFSVLLIVSCFLYCLYRNLPKFTQSVFLPILLVGGFVLFCLPLDPWGKLGGLLYVPLLRGVYSMGLGGALYYILPYYRKVPALLKWITLITSLLGSLLIGSSHNLYTVFVLFILLFLFQIEPAAEESLLSKFMKKYGYLSENIYYCHYIIVVVLQAVFKRLHLNSTLTEGIIYIACVIVCAVVFEKVINARTGIFGKVLRRE